MQKEVKQAADIRQRLWIAALIGAILCVFPSLGCELLRSEFYRGETAHLLAKGDRSYKSGDYQDAEACYKRAVRLDPACPRGHAALGHIAYSRGEFEEASSCYTKAVKLDPELEGILAPLQLEALRMKEAQAMEKRGLGLDRVMELIARGKEELETLILGDIPVAALANHAGSLSPKDQESIKRLAVESARAGGRPPRCMLLYGHLLASDDRCAFLAAQLLKDGARAVEGDDRQDAYITLGGLYIRMGRESEAAGAYEQALRAGSPEKEVLTLLSALYGVPADFLARPDPLGEGEAR
jgi:tetratricopeptide (TPR) repeat protein